MNKCIQIDPSVELWRVRSDAAISEPANDVNFCKRGQHVTMYMKFCTYLLRR